MPTHLPFHDASVLHILYTSDLVLQSQKELEKRSAVWVQKGVRWDQHQAHCSGIFCVIVTNGRTLKHIF